MKRIFITLIILFLFHCKSCEKENNNRGFNFEGCGECLNLNTGRVCTVEGTFYNSCLAICKQVKILCNGECPCPEKDK
ncbi:MAG: hypothetical protein KatS3mg129_0891 [Leptospiraceae bacterium]|nr:MAG: hypothetical protein KatS3mg129_0891 [Leptospiraceae bacterium]